MKPTDIGLSSSRSVKMEASTDPSPDLRTDLQIGTVSNPPDMPLPSLTAPQTSP